MSITDLQLQLHQIIDTINDEEKLSAVYTILKGAEGPFLPMSLEDYQKAIDESKQQIKEKKFTSVEDLEKESDNW